MKKCFLSLVVFLMLMPTANGQRKRAMFLNGYNFDSQSGWARSNAPNLSTPAQLQADGVIDDYQVPSLPPLNPRSTFDPALSAQLANHAMDKWIVVGHSFGGLIARLLEGPYPQLQPLLQVAGVQLKGILTLGTAHQGAPAAANLQAASSALQSFSNDVLAGPQWENQNGGYVDLILTVATDGRPYYQELAATLVDAKTSLDQTSSSVVGQLLPEVAPGSSFINALQTIAAVVPHLSVSGVESSPALIRWLPTVDNSDVPSQDEDANASQFTDAKNAYSSVWNMHRSVRDFFDYFSYLDIECYFSYCWEEQERDKNQRGMDAWGPGWSALNDIDNKWFSLHNEMLSATGTGEYWVSCNTGGGYVASPAQAEALFKPYDPCDYGEDGYWETYTYTYYYAEKSDGLVPLNRSKWYSGESFSDNNAAASSLTKANVSFDGAGEADGGYNNGEMRDLVRRYGQHQPSKPMQKTKDWMYYWVRY